jgi:hypothetical protein
LSTRWPNARRSPLKPGSPDDPRGWLVREIDRQASQIAASIADDPVYPYDQEQFTRDVATELDFGREPADLRNRAKSPAWLTRLHPKTAAPLFLNRRILEM